jgi:hypothetical protein
MDVKRYLPQKTPIGNVMKESPEGYWVLSNDFDRILAERDALQQLLNARDEEIERLKQELADERLQSLADGAFAEYCADRENQA